MHEVIIRIDQHHSVIITAPNQLEKVVGSDIDANLDLAHYDIVRKESKNIALFILKSDGEYLAHVYGGVLLRKVVILSDVIPATDKASDIENLVALLSTSIEWWAQRMKYIAVVHNGPYEFLYDIGYNKLDDWIVRTFDEEDEDRAWDILFGIDEEESAR